MKILLGVLIIVLVLWIGAIFYLSSQNGEQTFNLSYGLSSKIINIFFKEITQTETLKIHEYLRKIAHISLFATLGILSSLAFNIMFATQKKWKNFISFFASMFFVSGIALFDEWRKQFIDGRHFDMLDVKLNLISGFIGIVLVFIAIKTVSMFKKRY